MNKQNTHRSLLSNGTLEETVQISYVICLYYTECNTFIVICTKHHNAIYEVLTQTIVWKKLKFNIKVNFELKNLMYK